MARGTPAWAMDPDVRKRVERALSGASADAISEACELYGIPSDAWMLQPWLRMGHVPQTVVGYVEELRQRGETLGGAVILASIEFGIPDQTVSSWVYLPRRYSDAA